MGKSKGLIPKTSSSNTLKFFNTKGKEEIELVWKNNEIHIYRNKRYFDKIVFGDNVSGGGTPGGADGQIQYNDSGEFGADAGLSYNDTSGTLTIDGGFSGRVNLGSGGVSYLSGSNVILQLVGPGGTNIAISENSISLDGEIQRTVVSAAVSNPPTNAEIEANQPGVNIAIGVSYMLLDTNTTTIYNCIRIASGANWSYSAYTNAV